MADNDTQARRDTSAALFNNRYFAEVSAAILDQSKHHHRRVTTRQIASATGLADSLVRGVVVRLVEASLLAKLPRTGAGRTPQYYQVTSAERLRGIVVLAAPGTRKARRPAR